MKYLPYVLKHLRHTWVRTTSTVIGMALCIFLICTLQTVLAAMRQSSAGADPSRIITRHAVSIVFNLPIAYKARIQAVPGVRIVAATNWFGGIYRDLKDFFPNMAVDAEEYLAMYPQFILDPADRVAFFRDMRGAIVGTDVAEKFGFKIGDTLQLESFIPPYRIGKPFDFVIRGIYRTDLTRHPDSNPGLMLFHWKYLYESIRNRRVGTYAGANMYTIQVSDPARSGAVARAIDALFENSTDQTRTESEGAFLEGFNAMIGNLFLLLNGIGLAVAFTILLVTANTMSMAVRERRTEIAVLKTLGFPSGLVLSLVLAEAACLGLAGGVLGVTLAQALVRNLAKLPFMGLALGQMPPLVVSRGLAAATIGGALALGLLSGLVPALGAYRARITEMLRQA